MTAGEQGTILIKAQCIPPVLCLQGRSVIWDFRVQNEPGFHLSALSCRSITPSLNTLVPLREDNCDYLIKYVLRCKEHDIHSHDLGKEKVILVGDRYEISQCILNKSERKRKTLLAHRLRYNVGSG